MKSEAEILAMVTSLEEKANELCLEIGRPNVNLDIRVQDKLAEEHSLRKQVKLLRWALRD